MTSEKRKVGFATMTPERQRDIASKGGKQSHALGKAHRFTHEQAVEAGRKGARIKQANREALQLNKESFAALRTMQQATISGEKSGT